MVKPLKVGSARLESKYWKFWSFAWFVLSQAVRLLSLDVSKQMIGIADMPAFDRQGLLVHPLESLISVSSSPKSFFFKNCIRGGSLKLASFLLQDMLSFCRGKRLKGAFGGRQSSGACAKHRCPERNRSRWFREDVGIAWHCIPYSNGWWAAFCGIGKFNLSTFLVFLLLFMIETFSLKSSDLSTVPWAFPLVSVWSVKREIPKLMLSEETRW